MARQDAAEAQVEAPPHHRRCLFHVLYVSLANPCRRQQGLLGGAEEVVTMVAGCGSAEQDTHDRGVELLLVGPVDRPVVRQRFGDGLSGDPHAQRPVRRRRGRRE